MDDAARASSGSPPATEASTAVETPQPADTGLSDVVVADLRRWPPTRRVTVAAVAIIILAIVLYFGRTVLGPFVIGLLLAFLIDPPVEWMGRRGLPRWLGVLIVYVVVIAAIFVGLRLTIRQLTAELAHFIDNLPSYMDQLAALYASLDLPESVRQVIDAMLGDLGNAAGSFDPTIILPFVGGVAGILGSIVSYIVIPVWVFYLLKDRPRLMASIDRSLPAAWRTDVWTVSALWLRVFGQWLRGQLLLGLIVGLATFVGLLILGATIDPIFTRFAVFLSVTAGILELVPIIGPIIAAIPAVLLAATVGIQPVIAALLLYLVIQQVENHVLVPKIQGDAVDLHPTVVIFALVVGGAIAGLLGAILAVPITAAARDVFRYLALRLDEPPVPPDEAAALVRGDPARPPLASETPGPPGPPAATPAPSS
jgi:predicted PurR-regulated permease PerM